MQLEFLANSATNTENEMNKTGAVLKPIYEIHNGKQVFKPQTTWLWNMYWFDQVLRISTDYCKDNKLTCPPGPLHYAMPLVRGFRIGFFERQKDRAVLMSVT